MIVDTFFIQTVIEILYLNPQHSQLPLAVHLRMELLEKYFPQIDLICFDKPKSKQSHFALGSSFCYTRQYGICQKLLNSRSCQYMVGYSGMLIGFISWNQRSDATTRRWLSRRQVRQWCRNCYMIISIFAEGQMACDGRLQRTEPLGLCR